MQDIETKFKQYA